jgi:hypothetical protein
VCIRTTTKSIRIYNLHPFLSLLFVEKTIAKVARRSKRVYTLLDFKVYLVRVAISKE